MFQKKRMILALSVIFICGLITGAALVPVIVHKVAGNPYTKENLSERVFFTRYLKNVGLTDDQREKISDIISEYVDRYRLARDSFFNARNFIYSEFNTAMKEVLTPAQFEQYRANSEDDFRRRREFHDKMEREVRDDDDNKTRREWGGRRGPDGDDNYKGGYWEKK